jgi:hypothetical protein
MAIGSTSTGFQQLLADFRLFSPFFVFFRFMLKTSSLPLRSGYALPISGGKG